MATEGNGTAAEGLDSSKDGRGVPREPVPPSEKKGHPGRSARGVPREPVCELTGNSDAAGSGEDEPPGFTESSGDEPNLSTSRSIIKQKEAPPP